MFSFKTDKLLFLNISITKYDNEFHIHKKVGNESIGFYL